MDWKWTLKCCLISPSWSTITCSWDLHVVVTACNDSICNESNIQCRYNFIKFTRNSVNSGAYIGHTFPTTENCIILVEDTIFQIVNPFSVFVFHFSYESRKNRNDKNRNDTSVQAVLHNVTFASTCFFIRRSYNVYQLYFWEQYWVSYSGTRL